MILDFRMKNAFCRSICLRVFNNIKEFSFRFVQIWCALTLVTEIKNRVVRIQMLHLTGTAKKCIELTQAKDEAVLAGMKLNKQQQQIAEAGIKKLASVES
jgi:Rpp14/Pop5 family